MIGALHREFINYCIYIYGKFSNFQITDQVNWLVWQWRTLGGPRGKELVEQGNIPIYKHIKLLSHYSNISNNEFDIPIIIFERFAYLKRTPKAYMLKISPPNISQSVRHCGMGVGKLIILETLSSP